MQQMRGGRKQKRPAHCVMQRYILTAYFQQHFYFFLWMKILFSDAQLSPNAVMEANVYSRRTHTHTHISILYICTFVALCMCAWLRLCPNSLINYDKYEAFICVYHLSSSAKLSSSSHTARLQCLPPALAKMMLDRSAALQQFHLLL